MKIAIAGTGYVGLSNAMLLAQHNGVVALDIDAEKVELLNSGRSPIVDSEIYDFLANKDLNFTATLNKERAYKGADYVVSPLPPTTTRRPTTSTPERWNRSFRT